MSLFLKQFIFIFPVHEHLPRLFTVPYFFVRSFRYTASYRHGYLDFQMYRGGGRPLGEGGGGEVARKIEGL